MIDMDNKQIPPTEVDDPNVEVQQKIKELKQEIDSLLSGDSAPPHDIEEVLLRLERAEKLAMENSPKAWYELAKAKLVLHPQGAVSLEELAEGEVSVLREELYKVWRELNDVQHQQRHVNTTNAADWLNWGERALDENPPQRARAMYCVMRARYSLAKAQEFAEWAKWGYFAVFLEAVYLIGLPIGIFLISSRTGISTVEILTGKLLQIPFFVFVWGFLGGVTWCVYSAAYFSKRRLFDRHYLAWYLVHPWISAVLGGAVSLVILGGLSSLGSFDPNSQAGSALLSLISFVAGFSTNVIWKLLDRSVRKFFGETGSTRNTHEHAHEDALRNMEQ